MTEPLHKAGRALLREYEARSQADATIVTLHEELARIDWEHVNRVLAATAPAAQAARERIEQPWREALHRAYIVIVSSQPALYRATQQSPNDAAGRLNALLEQKAEEAAAQTRALLNDKEPE